MLGMGAGTVNASRTRIHANELLAAPCGFLLHFAPLNKARALRRGLPGLPGGIPRPQALTGNAEPQTGPARSRRMYAVIESGGKQHRVKEGEVLKLEKIEAAAGDTVNFEKVLMVGAGADIKLGAPYLQGGSVKAEIVSHGRHDKIRIVKFRRRKHYKRETGHRQWFTEVRITGISAG